VERIERAILVIRGHKVLLDTDLAVLYGVETKALNRAVKRNVERFPADFMFQLTREELDALRSQFVISKPLGVDAHNFEAAIAANLKKLGFGKG
jgi:hypothetical protein